MRATAPIARQDKDQWKCVSGDPRGLKRKAARALLQLLARATFYTCSESPAQWKLWGKKKSWPDVNATVVTDRMLFDNAILQRSRWPSPEKWFSSQILFSSLFFRKLEFAFEGQIVLTHYKHNRWIVSLGNMNSVVSVHIISFELKKNKKKQYIAFCWNDSTEGLSEGKRAFTHNTWKNKTCLTAEWRNQTLNKR